MGWEVLDGLIDELEIYLDGGPPSRWKEFWEKARKIQDTFNSHVVYPTPAQRQAAWDRFNSMRDAAAEQRQTQQQPSSESLKISSMIDKLEELVTMGDLVGKGLAIFGPLKMRSLNTPPPSLNIFSPVVYDWRPAWEQAKKIQALFRSGVRYPTREAREQVWIRFNDLRNELSRRSNADRETLFRVSHGWRDFLLALIEGERYSKSADAMFFFDPTTIEEMKRMGQRLRDCGRRLSEAKEYMLKEHKDECFQRIHEVRATHDVFWGKYKQVRERRQQEYREKIDDTLVRVEENISKNHERKTKAEDALGRCEANIEKLRDMRKNARGDEFRLQCDAWLTEAQTRRDSIRESIDRLEQWIHQDVERRNDIYSKRR